MKPSVKKRGELIKLLYISGYNAAEALLFYRRNHKEKQGPCSVKNIRNLIKKFEEMGSTFDKLRFGQSFSMLFFQLFYANLCHMCLVPIPFKVFSMVWWIFTKNGCCHSKVLKFCHSNCKCEISIVLNHQDFEPITFNNYI